MNHIKSKKEIKILKKQEQKILDNIECYEILDEMLNNQMSGIIPKMPLYRTEKLIDWLKTNKPKNDNLKKELKLIQTKLY